MVRKYVQDGIMLKYYLPVDSLQAIFFFNGLQANPHCPLVLPH